jgi:phosphate-selective porin OprO/OprP
MRGTCLPYWDEGSEGRYYVHLGACYSYRDTFQNQVRFRNSPEIRIEEPGAPNNFGPIFVDTGNIPASNFQLFDAEFAWINGSFSVQSEYAFTTVDQIGGPPLFFDGFMVQLSWFLTGEHRPYDRRLGIHKRMIPFNNFFLVRSEEGACLGLGAWEIAARYSRINLTDENILGNDLQDFTFGVNWYWNAYTRTRFNYIRAFLDDPVTGRSVTDIYGMRVDFEF